jgi:alkylhydroperoxidase family enzyme
VAAALADPQTAPIDARLRATAHVVEQIARGAITADDMRAALAAGVSRAQLDDALAVAFAFNLINRLADAFGFAVPTPAAFAATARMLIKRGYRM